MMIIFCGRTVKKGKKALLILKTSPSYLVLKLAT
jgi:hypothetical protein